MSKYNFNRKFAIAKGEIRIIARTCYKLGKKQIEPRLLEKYLEEQLNKFLLINEANK